MTITLAPQTETKLRELANREGQDVGTLVDTLLAASVEAVEHDFEESCAAITSSLASDPKHDISLEEYQAQFEAERKARRVKREGIQADKAV